MTDIIESVVKGDKPLAIIEKRKLPAEYNTVGILASYANRYGLYIVHFESPENDMYIISLSPANIDNYLTEYKRGTIGRTLAEYQRTMGLIFGFSVESTEEFILNPPDCDCSQCLGLNIYTDAMRDLVA